MARSSDPNSLRDFDTKSPELLLQLKIMLTALRKKVGEALQAIGQDPNALVELVEIPKRAGHGHLSLPVFALAKKMQKAPPVIAQEMAKAMDALKLPGLLKVESVQGF